MILCVWWIVIITHEASQMSLLFKLVNLWQSTVYRRDADEEKVHKKRQARGADRHRDDRISMMLWSSTAHNLSDRTQRSKGFFAICTKRMHIKHHTRTPGSTLFPCSCSIAFSADSRWTKVRNAQPKMQRDTHKRDKACTGSWLKSQANNTHIHMYVEQPNPLSLDMAPTQLDTMHSVNLPNSASTGRSWISGKRSWIAGRGSWIAGKRVSTCITDNSLLALIAAAHPRQSHIHYGSVTYVACSLV